MNYNIRGKVLRVMKLICLLVLGVQFTLYASSFAQQVTLRVKNSSIEKVLNTISSQTKYRFLYRDSDMKKAKPITIHLDNEPLLNALDKIFASQDLSYQIIANTINIVAKEKSSAVSSTVSLQKQVSVSVKDNKGLPLASVSVLIKGTNSGASTNEAGIAMLSLKPGDIVQVRYLGYVSQEITYTNQSTIGVQLLPDNNVMDEVVVVGYGTQKRVSMTSAVSEVKGEELLRRPVSNVQQALQGQVSGLTVVDAGGQPGRSNATIRVRGVTTIGDNNPLVIVDGIEQPMTDINPLDIASISLLKDASSTAIYGSRAANGVLLITTKRAESGKLAIAYDGFYAIQSAVNKPTHMGLEPYMRLQNTAFTNVGGEPKYTEAQIQEYVNANDRYQFPLPNTWFETMLKNAPQWNSAISMSGGNESFKGRLSLRYQDQQGIIDHSGSKIYDIRTNGDLKVSEKIKLQADVNYRYTTNTAPSNTFNVFNIMLHASQWTVPQYPDGTYGLSPQGRSPLVENEIGGFSKQANDYILGNVKGEWETIKNLKFTTQVAARINLFSGKDYVNRYEIRDYYQPDIVRKNVPINELTLSRSTAREYTINNLLNYHATFDNDHELDVLFGYSEIKHSADTLSAFRQNFYNNEIQSIGQGADDATRDNDGREYDWGLRSFFSRVNYAYKEKYLFEANARYDGSSRFTGNNQYSFFPSFSGGWRLSEESFWQPLKTVVNEFKLRGSWGKTGNQAVDLYSYFNTLNLLNYSFNGLPVQAYTQQKMANQDLTWETTTQTDVGFDAQLLNNKLTLSADYYKKKTDGILLVLPVPGTLGLVAAAQNAGRVDNTGWEFTAGYRDTFGKLGFNANINFNINRNEVINLAGTGPYISGSNTDPMFITGEGYPIRSFWGYLTDGFFQTQEEVDNYPTIAEGIAPGDVKYLDLNEDGRVNGDDMRYLGPSFPKYTFGTSLNFSYDRFNLNLMFQGAAKVYTRLSGALAEMGNQEGFTHEIYTNNYWTPDNPNAEFPRPTKYSLLNIQSADRMLLNGSYLRLKNVQLQYDLPSTILKNTFVHGLQTYVSATNILTFSKLNRWNLDPETPPGRANYYPQTALYTFGIRAQF